MALLADEKQEAAQNKEAEALKKRAEALDNMMQKKGEQEKQQFKKGQVDLEKELGFSRTGCPKIPKSNRPP